MPQQRRRNRFIIGVLSLCLLAGAALTASPAQAVDAVGPYYAEPAWDQKKAVVNRFVVLTNWNSEAVLDKETGLVWEKSPTTTAATQKNWNTARDFCIAKTVGGRKGWRLPSVHELASLVDPTQFNPALPLLHPFTNIQPAPQAHYWSATTNAAVTTNAWDVNFLNGDENSFDKASNLDEVWCVRGGMNADAY